MTTWRFSDGTVATLGGDIEGASLFAQEMRASLADPPLFVSVHPEPNGGVELDTNDLALFNAWLLGQMRKPYRKAAKLKLLEAPENIPALPTRPAREITVADDTLY